MYGLTADNASSNDTLTTELAKLVPLFDGSFRVRCFLHICNLVAKSLLRIFDDPKLKDDAEIAILAENLDIEELEAVEVDVRNGITSDEDDDDGLIDVMGELDEDEHTSIVEAIQPVKKVLVKVSKHNLFAHELSNIWIYL